MRYALAVLIAVLLLVATVYLTTRRCAPGDVGFKIDGLLMAGCK